MLCRELNITVISDEIYAQTTYDFSKFVSMGKIYPEGTFVVYKRTIKIPCCWEDID